jgi:hypothetical protein
METRKQQKSETELDQIKERGQKETYCNSVEKSDTNINRDLSYRAGPYRDRRARSVTGQPPYSGTCGGPVSTKMAHVSASARPENSFSSSQVVCYMRTDGRTRPTCWGPGLAACSCLFDVRLVCTYRRQIRPTFRNSLCPPCSGTLALHHVQVHTAFYPQPHGSDNLKPHKTFSTLMKSGGKYFKLAEMLAFSRIIHDRNMYKILSLRTDLRFSEPHAQRSNRTSLCTQTTLFCKFRMR